MSAKLRVSIMSSITVLLAIASLTSPTSHGGEEGKFNLNLHLESTPVLPPVHSNYAFDDYMSLYGREPDAALRSKTSYPFGLTRFKADKTMRVRGWEVGNNIYFGQAKVGKKWGVGLVVDRGTHYYGLNNRGIAFLKKF